jgi:hypothetical protein
MIQSICGKRTPGRSVLFNSNIRYYGLSAVHSRARLTTRARPPAAFFAQSESDLWPDSTFTSQISVPRLAFAFPAIFTCGGLIERRAHKWAGPPFETTKRSTPEDSHSHPKPNYWLWGLSRAPLERWERYRGTTARDPPLHTQTALDSHACGPPSPLGPPVPPDCRRTQPRVTSHD